MSKKLSIKAREVYAIHGIDEEAVEELLRQVQEDEETITEVLHFACKEALRDAQYTTRAIIAGTRKENYVGKEFSEEFQKKVQTACGRWYGWPLMDGTPLGQATRQQVLLNSEWFIKNGKAQMRNGTFLAEIAEKMKNDTDPVTKFLSETQLERMMEKAKQTVGENKNK